MQNYFSKIENETQKHKKGKKGRDREGHFYHKLIYFFENVIENF